MNDMVLNLLPQNQSTEIKLRGVWSQTCINFLIPSGLDWQVSLPLMLLALHTAGTHSSWSLRGRVSTPLRIHLIESWLMYKKSTARLRTCCCFWIPKMGTTMSWRKNFFPLSRHSFQVVLIIQTLLIYEMLITHECSIGAANPQIPLKLSSIDFMLVRGRICTT